jgi:GNAT superfamily N-acetyltransferase
MTTNVDYRLATSADLEELAAMRWDFRLEEADNLHQYDRAIFMQACVDFLRRELGSRRWAYWIAFNDRQIISHIFVQKMAKVPKPSRLADADGFMTNVYTRPAYRGQGIGSELLGRTITWAKAEDLGTLFVWPSERSIEYYQRAGFQADGEAMALELRPYVL